MNEIALLKKILSFVVIVLLTGVSVVPNISGDKPVVNSYPDDEYDIYVDDKYTSSTPGWGVDHFNKIQDGVTKADEDPDINTIYVYNGKYTEDITITTTLLLEGQSKENTTITGVGTDRVIGINPSASSVKLNNFTIKDSMGNGIKVQAQYVTISNFTIKNNDGGYGIVSECDELTILECEISNNLKGIMIFSDELSSIVISDCRIFDNKGEGILCNNIGGIGSNNLISSCDVFSNDKNGIFFEKTHFFQVVNCNITENSENLYIHDSVDNTIYNCSISSGNSSISLTGSSTGNIIDGCNITKSKFGIVITDSSNDNIIKNCNITDNIDYGIIIQKNGKIIGHANDNLIYHNNFINNFQNVYDECNNNWDNDYDDSSPHISRYSEYGGNYWDDHPKSGPDNDTMRGPNQNKLCPDGDGIIDYEYDITGKLVMLNKDHYPLVEPWPPIHGDDSKAPAVIIIYPNGGEHLFGNVTIHWYASDETTVPDNITIDIYLSNETGWDTIETDLNNTGNCTWNTTTFNDGMYYIRINATDENNNTGSDISCNQFIINNDGSPYVSRVILTDTTICSMEYVKDNDAVKIIADIIGEGVTNETISADLSELGGVTSVKPERYNGITATWIIPKDHVKCKGEGIIYVNVTATNSKGMGQNMGSIIADNTPPVVSIYKPAPGIYLFNMTIIPFPPKLLPLSMVIGKITVGATVRDKISGVSEVKWNVDGKEVYEGFEWSWNEREERILINLNVIAYDNVGNSASDELMVLKFF